MRLYRSVPVLGKPVPSKWGELLRKTKIIFDGGGGDFPIKTLWSTFSFIFNVPDSTLVVWRPGILWCKIFWQTPFSADNQGLTSTRYPTLPGFFLLLVPYPDFFLKISGFRIVSKNHFQCRILSMTLISRGKWAFTRLINCQNFPHPSDMKTFVTKWSMEFP